MGQAQVREKVQRILTDALGSVSIDSDGDFFVRFGSTVVFVHVEGIDEEATMIESFAIVLDDVKLTPEVYRWAATEGQRYRFGRAAVVEGDAGVGRILANHTLLGDFLDPEELKWAVIATGRLADDLDDELQGRFGGKKFGAD